MKFMVEFKVPRSLSQEFLKLIPEQQELVEQMLNSGEMISYSLAQDRTKLWTIVEAEDQDEAYDIVAELPLTAHMELKINSLMFSNTLQHSLPTFSAN